MRPINLKTLLVLLLSVIFTLACAPCAWAGNAPGWMHALTTAPLPQHDEKTDAVELYSESYVTVVSADTVKTHVREAYKILRPSGRSYGIIKVTYNPQQKISHLHGWCIPANGEDYEVKDKDAIETSLTDIEGGELVDDVKEKIIQIPAAEPGNIVGFEFEMEEHPLVMESVWRFQQKAPVREARYILQLPPGWSYKASWINSQEIKPETAQGGQLQWSVTNVGGITPETAMPPFDGIAAHMILTYAPPGEHTANSFSNWREMGVWYNNLTNGRRNASPEIREKALSLAAAQASLPDKIKAIGEFVQHQIRYVAIELGTGGVQPHAAADVFTHRYGDCKDKATLMSSMLHEIGVESYYVVLNAERGAVTSSTPANLDDFDHVILAIKLPDNLTAPGMVATVQHPHMGKILIFDPTSEFAPVGQLDGTLQAIWALLVTPEGGELIQLPQLPDENSGIHRTAKMTLGADGILRGSVQELRLGDRAYVQRAALRFANSEKEQIKPLESLLTDAFSNFSITKATVVNLNHDDQPFGYDYSFTANSYAKNVGGLLVFRPRVIGTKTQLLLEKKEPRKYPVQFDGPVKDVDVFEITLPDGYVVDDLPAPVNAEYSFASYHAKSEVQGKVLRYTRSFEIKELSVPASRADELKKFFRIISGDERSTAVLKPSAE